jgi:TadE-like protein
MARQIHISKITPLAIRQGIRHFMVGSDGMAGTAMIEITLCVPILIIVTVGLLNFGLYIYRNVQVQNAAQAGAQYAIQHGYSSSSVSSAVTNGACYPSTSCGDGDFTATISASPAPSRFCGCPSNTGVTQVATGACTLGMLPCGDGSKPGTYVTIQAQAPYSTSLPSVLSTNPISIVFSNTSACPGGVDVICATTTVRIQ